MVRSTSWLLRACAIASFAVAAASLADIPCRFLGEDQYDVRPHTNTRPACQLVCGTNGKAGTAGDDPYCDNLPTGGSGGPINTGEPASSGAPWGGIVSDQGPCGDAGSAGGGGGPEFGGSGGIVSMPGGFPTPPSTDWTPFLSSPYPVDLRTGNKLEEAEDLRVPLPGGDVTISRRYCSDPNFSRANVVGEQWTMPWFSFMRRVTVGTGVAVFYHHGGHESIRFDKHTGSSVFVSPPNSTLKLTERLSGSDVQYYVLEEPGQWTRIFYGNAAPGYSSGYQSALTGALYGEVSGFGRFTTMHWETYSNNRRRLQRVEIYSRPDDMTLFGRPNLIFNFFWRSFGTSGVDGQRISQIQALRLQPCSAPCTDPTALLVGAVKYTYWDDTSTGFHQDVGSKGDLVQVESIELADKALPPEDQNTPIVIPANTGTTPGAVVINNSGGDKLRSRITQYRYYRSDVTDDGTANQLKMVFMPQQLEHYSAHTAQAASGLLSSADSTVAIDRTGTTDDVTISQLASKVVKYALTTNGSAGEQQWRVTEELLQTNCGCSSGSSQGQRVLYAYFDNQSPLSNLSAQAVSGAEALKRVVRMREERYDGAWKPFRQTWHDMIEVDTNPHASIDQWERLPAKRVVEEMTPSGSSPSDWSAATVARSWVVRWQYYGPSDSGGYLGQLKSVHLPSATPGYTRAGVNDDQVIPTASAGSGLIYGLYYFKSGVGDARLEKISVRDGAGSNESTITEFTYATSNRGDLLESVKQRRGASDYETTTFGYTFVTDDVEILGMTGGGEYEIRVMTGREITVEAETTGENGPGGGGHLTTEVYDNDGQLESVERPDGSMLELTRDAATGRVTVRGETYDGNSANRYETLMKYDQVGRLVRTRAPSGATTNIRRELLTFGADDNPAESGSPGQPTRWVETHLPAATGLSGGDGAAYDGPIVREYLDAANQSLGTTSFAASAVSRDSAGDLTGTSPYYTLGSERSRTYLKRNLAGQVGSERRYHDVGSGSGYYDTTYSYDELGRLRTVTAPTGTITRYTYDARNRIVQEETGTSLSTDNLRVTAEHFYDDATFNNGALNQGVGDGNLSASREWVSGSSGDARVTEHKHDWRNRRVVTINPEKPVELIEYDNLDRPVARALFESDWTTALPSSIDDSTTARRQERGLVERTHYGQRGLVWRTERASNPSSTGTTNYLVWDTWRDSVGRVIKQTAPNSPTKKVTIDAWGRASVISMTDAGGDTSHSDAEGVSGDTVYEQIELHYVPAGTSGATTRGSGLVDLATFRRRTHDYASTGALTHSGASAVSSFKAVWYDSADRPTSIVDFGTNTAGFNSAGTDPTTGGTPVWPYTGSTPITTSTSGFTDTIVSQRAHGDRGLIETLIDPEGKKTKSVYDDLGRQVGVLEHYSNGIIERDGSKPSGWKLTDSDASGSNMDQDRATITAYDGSDNVTFQTAAYWDGSAIAYQNTQYFYGVRESGDSISGLQVAGSALRSNDLLARVIYPDGDTSSDNVTYAYNRQGELISLTDQAGNSHAYTRDKRGRVITDAASFASGTALDTTIDGLAYTFDGFGRRKTAKSKTGSTVINAVEFEYTNLWQISKVKQNPLGDVVSSPGSTSNQAEIAYAYDTLSSSAPNASRLSSLTYPTTTVVVYAYGNGTTSPDAESKISRLRTLTWNGAPGTTTPRSAVWSYVGLRMPVIEEYPLTGESDPAVVLDRWSDPTDGSRTSGTYKNLDRFGRVTHQLWAWAQHHSGSSSFRWNTTNNGVGRYGPPYYDMAYEYTKASDVTKRLDRRGANSTTSDQYGRVGRGDRDEVYTNDGLHRLKQADRGKQTSSFASGGSRSQQWSLDTLGNWPTAVTDLNGDGTYSTSSSGPDRFDLRKHNAVNEIDGGIGGGTYDQRFYDPGLSSSSFDLLIEYDLAGNMTRRDVLVSTGGGSTSRWDYKFDAWNRLVKATVTPSGGSPTDRAKYTYNALHWRVSRAADNEPGAGANPDQANLFYYDASWRPLEERVLNFTSTPSDPFDGFNSGYEHAIKRVWDPHYIDDLIYVQTEWIDRSGGDSGVPNPTGYFAITDRLYSVVGLVNGDSTAEGRLTERARYTPYGTGRQEAWSKGDVDGDGDVDFTDQNFVLAAFGASLSTAGSAYDPACDFDMDGNVNNVDHNLLLGNFGSVTPPAEGRISSQDIGNTIGFGGYMYDPALDEYVVRHRWAAPALGHWHSRDPLGYADSLALYEITSSSPLAFLDPLGLRRDPSFPMPFPNETLERLRDDLNKKCDGGGLPSNCSVAKCKEEANRIVDGYKEAFETLQNNGRNDICLQIQETILNSLSTAPKSPDTGAPKNGERKYDYSCWDVGGITRGGHVFVGLGRKGRPTPSPQIILDPYAQLDFFPWDDGVVDIPDWKRYSPNKRDRPSEFDGDWDPFKLAPPRPTTPTPPSSE